MLLNPKNWGLKKWTYLSLFALHSWLIAVFSWHFYTFRIKWLLSYCCRGQFAHASRCNAWMHEHFRKKVHIVGRFSVCLPYNHLTDLQLAVLKKLFFVHLRQILPWHAGRHPVQPSQTWSHQLLYVGSSSDKGVTKCHIGPMAIFSRMSYEWCSQSKPNFTASRPCATKCAGYDVTSYFQ